MEFFKGNSNFDFLGKQTIFIGISVVLIVASVVSLLTRGLKYGVDFTGGTEVQMKFKKAIKTGEIRDILIKVGLEKSVVQEFGKEENNEFLIRIENRAIDVASFEKQAINDLKGAITQANLVSFKYKGGENGYLKLDRSIDPETLRKAIVSVRFSGMILSSEVVEPFGKESDNEYVVKFVGVAQEVEQALVKTLGRENLEVLRVETVGPKVGAELKRDGLLSVLYALFFILLYIAFRFDMKFAPGAVIALIHDVTITIGFFSFFQWEFSLSIIAALLAIIGYSLNDTIVVFDRIRDNLKRLTSKKLSDVINSSVNQTISRTILTSGTTLIVTVTLLLVGGEIIRNFAMALTLGIVIGTYSSIYIASPIVIYLNQVLKQDVKGKIR